eukprot:scaffold401414_cov32-Prasinocladus_malaysianus.AAC.1
MTVYQQQEDRAMLFDAEVRAQLAVLLGGRAAEQLTCGQISTGASDDIQRATSMAQKSETGIPKESTIDGDRAHSVKALQPYQTVYTTNVKSKFPMAVAEWGLSGSIGPLNMNVLAAGGAEEALLRESGGNLTEMVEAEVKSLIEGALECAMEVINVNK